jgi:hypothetical protein
VLTKEKQTESYIQKRIAAPFVASSTFLNHPVGSTATTVTMRQFSLSSLFVLLTTLLAVVLAQDYTTVYTTYTTTRTVYVVQTQTLTGYNTVSAANSSSTYTGSVGTILPTGTSYNTTAPSLSSSAPTAAFTGAASKQGPQVFLAAALAGLGLLAL